MFCGECGNELQEGAKFCAKCGAAVSSASDSANSAEEGLFVEAAQNASEKAPKKTKSKKGNPFKRYVKRWKRCKQEKFKGIRNILWTVFNAFAALLIVIRIGLMFFMNIDMNGIVYYPQEDGTAIAKNEFLELNLPLFGRILSIKQNVRIGFHTYDVECLEIGSGQFDFMSNLSNVEIIQTPWDVKEVRIGIGEDGLPRLKDLNISADYIRVDILGDLDNLEYVWLNAKEMGCFYYRPSYLRRLSSISVSNVYLYDLGNPSGEANNIDDIDVTIRYDSNRMFARYTSVSHDRISYSPEEFNVGIKIRNDLVSRALLEDRLTLKHSFEDLYGTWNYYDSKNEVLFSLDFQESGYVKVTDGLGLLGMDLFTFKEVDQNTIALKSEAANAWGELVSLSVPYELFGDQLTVSIFGQDIVLYQEDGDRYESYGKPYSGYY